MSNSVFSEAGLAMVLGSKKHSKQKEESGLERILTFTSYLTQESKTIILINTIAHKAMVSNGLTTSEAGQKLLEGG